MDNQHRLDIYAGALLSMASSGMAAMIKYNVLSLLLMCISIVAAIYSILAARYTAKEKKMSIRKMEREWQDMEEKQSIYKNEKK